MTAAAAAAVHTFLPSFLSQEVESSEPAVTTATETPLMTKLANFGQLGFHRLLYRAGAIPFLSDVSRSPACLTTLSNVRRTYLDR